MIPPALWAVGPSERLRRWWCRATMILLFFAPMANAEEGAGHPQPGDQQEENLADLSIEELMEVQVVVTAARREQSLTSVPYAVSVITADDIRKAGARSITDALRLAPGVDVADLSFGNAAASPRGFHGFLSNSALVLVDGRQIYDSMFGGTLWGAWPFLMEDIERIEIIRGPGGVTWGANAVNGVINIITKDPADQLGLTLSTSGGSRGSFKQYVGYGLLDGKLRLRLSAEYEASDGFREGGSILRNLDDDYKGKRFTLKGVYDLTEKETLTFSAGSSIVDGGFPPTPLAGFGLKRNSEAQANYAMLNWVRRISETEHFDFRVFVNDFFVSAGISQIDYRYQQIGVQLAHTFDPDEAHTRTRGIDTRFDLLDAGNSDPHMLSKNFVSTGIIGVYLQDEWRFAPRWIFSLGSRIDYEFYGGFQPSARVSLSHEVSENAIVYGAVSRAFHMPTAAGRFLNMPLLNGLARVTSNDDIDPTTLLAYEIGYRDRLFGRLETSMNLFWHEYDEVSTLSPRLGPPGLLQQHLNNRAGNVSLYGAEFEARYMCSQKLELVANYTYQQLDWDVDEPFTDRDFITPPKHKAMVGALYEVNDDLNLSGHLYYVDAAKAPNPANPFVPSRIDPSLRLDLRAEYAFQDDRGSIAVGVANLLDSGHFEGSTLFLNDAEVPRMVYAELRLHVR